MRGNAEFTIVQLVVIDETGDSYHRMRWPGAQLSRQEPRWRVINLDARDRRRHQWAREADLLVVYQSHDEALLPIVSARRGAGRKTLVEYSDNFYAPPPASPVAPQWGSPLIWQIYEQFMAESDGVIVTGPGLQELFAGRTDRPLHVLENHLPACPDPFEELWEEPEEEIRIGWAGSLGHMPDLLAVGPLLRSVLGRDQRVMLHLMGNQAIPEELRVVGDRLRFTPWGSMDEYYRFWGPVHIGIAPLLDTAYNRCRSDIKAVEMAGSGVLPLLTKALPYRSFLEETGMCSFSSTAELETLLLSYLTDFRRIRRDARHCHEYVCRERLGDSRRERRELYRSLLPARPNDFPWSLPAGCHEVQGRLEPISALQSGLKEIRAMLREKRFAPAASRIEPLRASFPSSADLALLEVQCLLGSGNPRAGDAAARGISSFPLDIRFRLMRVQTLRDDRSRTSQWEKIVSVLTTRCPAYRRFFEAALVRHYCREHDGNESVRPLAARLAELYPQAAALVFRAAQHLERSGDDAGAKRYFEWLDSEQQNAQMNAEFFSTVDSSYIRCWSEALSARVRGWSQRKG